MSGVELWLAVFILGVLIFMVGQLLPERTVAIIGAIVTVVGGIGWFVVSLS